MSGETISTSRLSDRGLSGGSRYSRGGRHSKFSPRIQGAPFQEFLIRYCPICPMIDIVQSRRSYAAPLVEKDNYNAGNGALGVVGSFSLSFFEDGLAKTQLASSL